MGRAVEWVNVQGCFIKKLLYFKVLFKNTWQRTELVQKDLVVDKANIS